jgi:hypothetical protein
MRNSNRVWVLVGVAVVVVIIALAFVWKPAFKNPVAVVPQGSIWINVSTSTYPPRMVIGVPVLKGGTVITDRYYDNAAGLEYGEYALETSFSGQQNQSSLYSTYLTLLQNNKQITIQSNTSSSIVVTEPGYAATITFTNPTPQAALVDITYNQTTTK